MIEEDYGLHKVL